MLFAIRVCRTRGAIRPLPAALLAVVFALVGQVRAAELQPYSGESVAGVDCSTLHGKVMCGYQGWFNTPGDGAGRGWAHYGRSNRFEPGRCNIDLWPDVSELTDDEKVATPFRHADGSTACVYNSNNRQTVLRHFEWMQTYGIDGVFVQRFAVETFGDSGRNHFDAVLAHCREGANRHGRAYAVMYDLSGLQAGQIDRVIDDWKRLRDDMHLGCDKQDRAYLRHAGKPIVGVWGVGFNDNRRYSLDECAKLIDLLKNDPKYGGCTVVLGVPTGWRTLDRDSLPDPQLHDVILQADIVSPWTVGRYRTPREAKQHGERVIAADLAWCREHGKEYLPVAFPGFSWHNMQPSSPLDDIPRRKGEFLWAQYTAAKQAGVTMLYQAMFDELDEATAIFKCTNNPPIGASKFVADDDLPSDHYLWLTGAGGKLLRGEIELAPAMPKR